MEINNPEILKISDIAPPAVGEINSSKFLTRVPTEEEVEAFANKIREMPIVGNDYSVSVLGSIVKIQKQHNANMSELKTSFKGASGEVVDLEKLLKLQVDIYQMTLSIDLTAKVASKVPTTLEVLMRG